MGRKYDFKYLVIGSGPAGLATALGLAKAKKNVGLVEGGPFGGANLNTRDVPYAATLDFSHTYYKAMHLPEFNLEEFSFGFPSIVAHQLKATIEASSGNNPKFVSDAGVIYIPGYANFLDAHTVAVGDRKLSSENFILATGAELDASGISGLDTVDFLTPENALKIRRLPEAVIIVGGGSTGCEIAEYYATLGAKTLIAEQASHLLPEEDPEVGAAVEAHLADDLGAMVLTSSKVLSLNRDSMSDYVVFEHEESEKMVRVDTIVLATGSKPALAYGLENAGVKLKKDGTLVLDKYFQTSAKHIYAVGDCAVGGFTPPARVAPEKTKKPSKSAKTVVPDGNFAPKSSSERAEYEGRLLALNLSNKTKSLPNYKGFVRMTNTLPAVACFGPTEEILRKQHVRCRKTVIKLCDTPTGKIYGDRLGFIKLISDHSGRLIAGSIVCDSASAIASEVSLAIRHRLNALELASTPHPINDYSYALSLAAKRLVIGPEKK